jgi:hypothetical protein
MMRSGFARRCSQASKPTALDLDAGCRKDYDSTKPAPARIRTWDSVTVLSGACPPHPCSELFLKTDSEHGFSVPAPGYGRRCSPGLLLFPSTHHPFRTLSTKGVKASRKSQRGARRPLGQHEDRGLAEQAFEGFDATLNG